jgi:sodium/hydrogen antiporter
VSSPTSASSFPNLLMRCAALPGEGGRHGEDELDWALRGLGPLRLRNPGTATAAVSEQLITAIAVISACVIVWGLVSARLGQWDVTAPIAFVVFGLGATHGPLALFHLRLHSSDIRSLAELTLALVLFADASRVNAKTLRADVALPARLLAIGLPLTIGFGAVAAAGVFAGAGLWVAATIGAIVAPTDAALGASIMQDERVPTGVRRALNVESGLNDGIATPFVNLFLAGAIATEAVHTGGIGHAAVALLGGAALGAGAGAVGAILLRLSRRAGWSAAGFLPLSVLGLALFAYAAALLAGTNGFVAAFIAGMAFGTLAIGDTELLAFGEEAGTLLSLLVWFSFGAVMVVPGFEGAGWQDVVFALLALTVVRVVPVALALVGSGFDKPTAAFIGWFGPRGLASVVFGLIAVDSLGPADGHLVLCAVTVTVTASVLAHGISASPLARRYGEFANRSAAGPVHSAAPAVPTRRLSGIPKFLVRWDQP